MRRKLSIGDWHDQMPSAKVTRAELMRVLEGFDFISRDGVVIMFRDYERIRRQMRWYRRIWHWLKLLFERKKPIDELHDRKEQQQEEEVDERAAKLTEEKVAAPTLNEVKEAVDKSYGEMTDKERELHDAGS